MKIMGDVELSEGSQLTNATLASGTAFPTPPSMGEMFYLTVGEIGLYFYNGTDWINVTNYNNLHNKPTKLSDFDNDADYVTGSQAIAALATKADKEYVDTVKADKAYVDNSKANKAELSAVATSGSYNNLTDLPTIVVKQELTTTVPAMSATSTKSLSNTTPTVADGTQIWSQAITPIESTSRINVTGSFVVSHGTASRQISLALFRDDVCIATTLNFLATANKGYVLGFNWIDLPGSTAEVTYTIRMWADNSGTWYTGRLATPYYAGTLASNYISVIELA